MTTRRHSHSVPAAPGAPAREPAPAAGELARFLAGHRRLLLLTHERPDGDAFGSLIGLTLALAEGGVSATAFLTQPVPARYGFLPFPSDLICVGSLPAGSTFDAALVVDCSNRARVDCPRSLPWDTVSRLPLGNVDHHADNERYGTLNLVEPGMAATAQLLAESLQAAGSRIPAAAASWLLVGVIMDTGAFQFSSTTAATLNAAAVLVRCGADYTRIMDGLFFQEPLGRRRLAARLIEHARFAHAGRVLYSVLDSAWFAELGVAPDDTEGLIDSLRTIAGVEIACLIQPETDAIRLSLRARSPAFPVDGLAHELGGGGHPLAAGARLQAVSVAEAVRILLEKTGKIVAS